MRLSCVLRLLCVAVLWAACFPLITVGLDLAPHLPFATLRAGTAGAALLAVAAILGRRFPTDVRTLGLVTAVGAGATFMGFLGMFHAAEFVAPGMATVIANAQPLFAALIAGAVLDERIGRPGWAGLATGFAGVVLMASQGLTDPGAHGFTVGVLYILLAAIGVAAGNVATKMLAGRVDAVVAMGLQLVMGSVMLAAFGLGTGQPFAVELSSAFLLLLIVLAIPGTAVAFWLWFSVLEETTLNAANAFTYLVPLFALAIGIWGFGERLHTPDVVGGFLIVSGVLLVQRDRA